MLKTHKTARQIRQEFFDYFTERQHTLVPSAPVVPADDPTLLFTNAGMNQFKDVFLGTGRRSYVRAVDTQKCIRVSGKHNDLEEVGHDTYHHTYFEMLGNWSFGDYFKSEAIAWAWDLLTRRWGIPKERMYATVFAGDERDGLPADEEAEGLWRSVTDIDPAHVLRFGKKDNFWEMADTGPCGPNSEIHVDLTADCSGAALVNADDPRVIEIWNLVFIQFNRSAGGILQALPAQHVDTGMGFERLVAVLQGTDNYSTDVFSPLMERIGGLVGQRYTDAAAEQQVAFRVLADHVRMLSFSIADGALPSNEGRGYVLRRLLRRASRYGRLLEMHEPFIHRLVAHGGGDAHHRVPRGGGPGGLHRRGDQGGGDQLQPHPRPRPGHLLRHRAAGDGAPPDRDARRPGVPPLRYLRVSAGPHPGAGGRTRSERWTRRASMPRWRTSARGRGVPASSPPPGWRPPSGCR